MQNTLLDVHNLLVEQLEMLAEVDVENDDPKKIELAAKKAHAAAALGTAIAKNANVAVQAQKAAYIQAEDVPSALTMERKSQEDETPHP